MTDKEKFLVMYPNAICHLRPTTEGAVRLGVREKWLIYEDLTSKKLLGSSYQNEETAWKWALYIANKALIDALQR